MQQWKKEMNIRRIPYSEVHPECFSWNISTATTYYSFKLVWDVVFTVYESYKTILMISCTEPEFDQYAGG